MRPPPAIANCINAQETARYHFIAQIVLLRPENQSGECFLSVPVTGSVIGNIDLPFPYWTSSTEIPVPCGQLSVTCSDSQAAVWYVRRVADSRAVAEEKREEMAMGINFYLHGQYFIRNVNWNLKLLCRFAGDLRSVSLLVRSSVGGELLERVPREHFAVINPVLLHFFLFFSGSLAV